jgi:hypothetical protein
VQVLVPYHRHEHMAKKATLECPMKGSGLGPKPKWFIIFQLKYKRIFLDAAFILPPNRLFFVVTFTE